MLALERSCEKPNRIWYAYIYTKKLKTHSERDPRVARPGPNRSKDNRPNQKKSVSERTICFKFSNATSVNVRETKTSCWNYDYSFFVSVRSKRGSSIKLLYRHKIHIFRGSGRLDWSKNLDP